MKTKHFAPSFLGLQTLGFLALLLACWSVKAQSYDYYYTVDRYTDSSGDVIDQYDNWAVDPSGNTYSDVLPVYVGMASGNPSETDLNPGYGVDITDLANGGGVVVGSPFALPAGDGGADDPDPKFVTKTNKHTGQFTITSIKDNGGLVWVYTLNGQCLNTNGSALGAIVPAGCWRFLSGPLGQNPHSVGVDFAGCHVTLQAAPETGQFTTIWAVLGGGAYFPSATPPQLLRERKLGFHLHGRL